MLNEGARCDIAVFQGTRVTFAFLVAAHAFEAIGHSVAVLGLRHNVWRISR